MSFGPEVVHIFSIIQESSILSVKSSFTYAIKFCEKFDPLNLMPSPSAFSKFSSSILKFFKHAQFFVYTQNHLGILKS